MGRERDLCQFSPFPIFRMMCIQLALSSEQPNRTDIMFWAGWWEGLCGIWALLDHIFSHFSPPILAEVPFQQAGKAAVHTLPCTGFVMLLGCLVRNTFSESCCPGVNTHPLARTGVRPGRCKACASNLKSRIPLSCVSKGRHTSSPGVSPQLHSLGFSWGRCHCHFCQGLSIPVAGPPTLPAGAPKLDRNLLFD